MHFIIRMSLREFRASWRRLLFFFLCVAIGVGAIVALRSVIQSLRLGLVSEARTMIASDVIVQTNRAWTPEVRRRVDEILSSAPVLAETESIETPTMVRAEEGTAVARMVELRAVEAAFPFYGTLALAGGQAYSHDLLANRGALVGPELLVQLGMKIGDRLLIAGQPFTIRGVIAQEPGRRIGAFSFGARVIVDLADLRQTGLLGFGSRASYQRLLKVREDGVDRLTSRLREELRGNFASARSYRSLEDDIGEDLLRAENYLSLVGFVIVVLGGIGVWSVTRVFVRQKIKSVAILKCIGATTAQVLATYVAQVALLGLAGSLTGVALAAIAMRMIPASLTAVVRRRLVRSHHVGDPPGRVCWFAGVTTLRARPVARSQTDQAPPSAAWRRDRHATSRRCRQGLWTSVARQPDRLGAGGDGGGRDRGPRGGRVVAGGHGARRVPRLWRLRCGCRRPLRCSVVARPRGAAARGRTMVSAAPRGAEPRAAPAIKPG